MSQIYTEVGAVFTGSVQVFHCMTPFSLRGSV